MGYNICIEGQNALKNNSRQGGEREKMKTEVKKYLSEIGKKGGASKSAAKKAASKENGKKGGRPVKKKYGKFGDEGEIVEFTQKANIISIEGKGKYMAVDCINGASNVICNQNKESKLYQQYYQYRKDSAAGKAFSFKILDRKNGSSGWRVALYPID